MRRMTRFLSSRRMVVAPGRWCWSYEPRISLHSPPGLLLLHPFRVNVFLFNYSLPRVQLNNQRKTFGALRSLGKVNLRPLSRDFGASSGCGEAWSKCFDAFSAYCRVFVSRNRTIAAKLPLAHCQWSGYLVHVQHTGNNKTTCGLSPTRNPHWVHSWSAHRAVANCAATGIYSSRR